MIFLKNANYKDSNFIFNLKNSKDVSRTSIKKKKINFRNHEKWLKKKLSEKKSFLFIVCEKKNNLKVGYVRLDYKNFFYRVTIAIIKNKTRLKYGQKSLIIAEKKIKAPFILIAEVLTNNFKSIKLFKKSGYSEVEKRNKIILFLKFISKK